MHHIKTLMVLVAICLSCVLVGSTIYAAEDSGSIGVEGRISSPPPTVGATISVPRDGQIFADLPVTVAGICQDDLLIKVFKNNVFAGSTQCSNGSFSVQIDLFSGLNELVARVYDELDQPGPDSNIVRVTFNDGRPGSVSRVGLTSNFAKRGANPGQSLVWPVILSGGQGPYAISVDWGDGKPVDLSSRPSPGPFDIEHIYERPGVYNIIVKAVDASGAVAYLQLVGVGNGPLGQDGVGEAAAIDGGKQPVRLLWQPAAALIPLIIMTFWLGRRYELKLIRQRLDQGERPF